MAGRPTKYKKEYNEQVEKLCRLGATDKDIADFFNVCEATVNNWKLNEPQFLESLRRGKIIADMNVSESLYKKATGYKTEDIKIFQYEGQPVIVPYEREYQPDTTSAIFWLKNRRPDEWRDKQEIEHSGEVGVVEKQKLIDKYLSDEDE